ncbi:MAG: hypothetical protein MI724_07820 [Spirochaetales bacterium]|nr:hypothetical protein [Spirochaetales bacterium]
MKVILFAYSGSILSSRKIEKVCRTNVVCMALSGDMRLDRAMIARFVTGRQAVVRLVFRDVLMIAAQYDLAARRLIRTASGADSSDSLRDIIPRTVVSDPIAMYHDQEVSSLFRHNYHQKIPRS